MTQADLEPGLVLAGTYEIVREIGAGGMGAVYEAKHLRLSGRKVAIKVLLKGLAEDAETFARFKREAEIGAKNGHPHIVQVTDFDKLADGSPFLVMELLDGEDLHHKMNRGTVPEALIYRVVRETGSALAAAHRQGIVHRDLKPHNIFLVRVEEADGHKEHVKLLDFGISKIAASQTVVTRDSSVLGTPRYMAPEQALGKHAEIDGRTDQFALATVAYELFAGRPAFDADSATAVLYKVVYEAPPPLSEVAPQLPKAVARAIERGMSKSRDDRFPDIGSFVHAVLDGAGLRGDTDELLAPTEKDAAEPAAHAEARAKKRRLVLSIGAGAAAVAIGAALVLAFAKKPVVATVQPPHETTIAKPPEVEKPLPIAAPVEAVKVPPPVEKKPEVVTPPQPVAKEGIAKEAKPEAVEAVKKTKSPRVAERPEAARALDEAEARLDANDYRDAIRKAQQSIGLQDTPRAHRIITLSYCALNDLGNAKAAYFSVSSSEKRSVAERCRKLGTDL